MIKSSWLVWLGVLGILLASGACGPLPTTPPTTQTTQPAPPTATAQPTSSPVPTPAVTQLPPVVELWGQFCARNLPLAVLAIPVNATFEMIISGPTPPPENPIVCANLQGFEGKQVIACRGPGNSFFDLKVCEGLSCTIQQVQFLACPPPLQGTPPSPTSTSTAAATATGSTPVTPEATSTAETPATVTTEQPTTTP